MQYDLYADIAARTKGDIYIGVVGPVRTGKSTFVSRFMEKIVVPRITDQADKVRATDELPQSAEGKTIMTTEPKFVPNRAVKLTLGEKINLNARMIDCVGYMVEGALGTVEEGAARRVKTPWSAATMPFQEAAELGTHKVITEHSNIAVVVTTDGSISNITRDKYLAAEEKVISQLIKLGKPFVVVLNSNNPQGEQCVAAANELSKKFNVTVVSINLLTASTEEFEKVLSCVLDEFPISRIAISIPRWMQTLPYEHRLITGLAERIRQCSCNVCKMKDAKDFCTALADNDVIAGVTLDSVSAASGVANYTLAATTELFYNVLTEEAGRDISDEHSLMAFVTESAEARRNYEELKDALLSVKATGYGVVAPSVSQMVCEEPEIVKSGNRYGVRLKASAPSLHIMQVDVTTEVSPMVGTEQQSQYLLSEWEHNPKGIWQTNMFGKSMSSLAKEGLQNKLASMPQEVQEKMRKTVTRIVNEGKGSLLCILL